MSPDKLRALADRIDHEQLWRLSGIDQRDNLNQDQRDRLDAAVELRRWADAKKPGRWLVIPPNGPMQFSAQTLDAAVKMASRNEECIQARAKDQP